MVSSSDAPTASGRLRSVLARGGASLRLRAALDAGSRPDAEYAAVLVERCAVEPDFFVRDMLTWALTRHPPDATVPLLLKQLFSPVPQARSQALHTLSKVRDPRGWEGITPELMRDDEVEVARAAWRAAVVLGPAAARAGIAVVLATQLGRGDPDVWLSLVRAFAVLGDDAGTILEEAATRGDASSRIHAIVTRRLIDDPDEDFDTARFEAERIVVLTRPDPADER